MNSYKMNKQAWLLINDPFRKAKTLEKLAEQKKAQSMKADVKVEKVGIQSGRGAPANRGQPRGGRCQYNGY
jgi:hypothetical protein